MFFYLTIFLAVFAVAAAKPHGFIYHGVDLPEGYTESDIVWTGLDHLLADRDGANPSDVKAVAGLSLNGTIQSVTEQLKSMGYAVAQPSFNDTDFETLADTKENHPDLSPFHHCGTGGDGWAKTNMIETGADYLIWLPDNVRCSNIPFTCGRISCSYKAAIWWCNHQDVSLDFACNRFGKDAWEVIRYCQKGDHVRGLAGDNGLMYTVVAGRSPEAC